MNGENATRVQASSNGDGEPKTDVSICKFQHWFGEGENAHHALKNVDLQIPRGEVVVLTGHSGSGKTTLLTLIGGLRQVQKQRQTEANPLAVLGVQLLGAADEQIIKLRRRIGFIFQHHNLFESLTATQNVMMGAEVIPKHQRNKTRSDAVNLLSELGLQQRVEYKPGNLSGGQKQRVAVARALINDPELVLADEPTAALDEEASINVVNLLKRIAQERQTTVIIVTHDHRILDHADRRVSMEDGRITRNRPVQLTRDIFNQLRKSESFQGYSDLGLLELADNLTPNEVKFAAGEDIIVEGDMGQRMYVIARGSVDVLKKDAGLVNTLEVGQIFGEAALKTDEPRNATIRARETTEVYYLSKDDFKRIFTKDRDFSARIERLLVERG